MASAEEGVSGNNVIRQPSVDNSLLGKLELVEEAESEAGVQIADDGVGFALGEHLSVVRADFEGSGVEVFADLGNGEGNSSGVSALASDGKVAVIGESAAFWEDIVDKEVNASWVF